MKMYVADVETTPLKTFIAEAEEAAHRNEFEKALELYSKALEALTSGDAGAEGHADQEAAIRNARANLFIQLGQWQQAMDDVDKVVNLHGSVKDAGQIIRARIHNAQVTSYYGEYGEAVSALEMALEEAKQSAGPLEQALVHVELGSVYARIGEHQPGRKSLEEACRILERSLIDAEAAAVLANANLQLGLAAFRERKIDDARNYYWKALKLLRKHAPGTRTEADTYRYLGILADNQGTYTEALHYHQQALKQYHALKNSLGEIKTYNSIGQTCMELSRLEEALYFMRKAQTMARALGADAEMATIYGKLGAIYMKREEYDKAVESNLKDVELSRRFGNYRALAFAIRNLGNSYRTKGEHDDALHYLKECLDRFAELQDQVNVARVHLDLAQVYIDRNMLTEAEAELAKATEGLGTKTRGGDHAYAATLAGKILRLRQQYDEARKHYEEALDILGSTQPSARLVEAHFEVGQLHSAIGNTEKAIEHLKEACRLSRELGLKRLMEQAVPALEKLDELALVDILVEEVAAERPAPA